MATAKEEVEESYPRPQEITSLEEETTQVPEHMMLTVTTNTREEMPLEVS